jgi:hypothetical protein
MDREIGGGGYAASGQSFEDEGGLESVEAGTAFAVDC